MSERPLLVTERLRHALDAVARFDKLTDAEIDRIVDDTLPDVPEHLRVEALEFVANEWEREKVEKLTGFLAAWQPEGKAH